MRVLSTTRPDEIQLHAEKGRKLLNLTIVTRSDEDIVPLGSELLNDWVEEEKLLGC